MEKIEEEIPPAAAAKQVVTSVRDVNSGSADRTEPPLNPNQHSQRINTPAAASGKLCPGIAKGFQFLSKRPIRAPNKKIATKAAHPPTELTSVEPAKS